MTDKSEPVICADCGTPVAERRPDGTLVILSRHHGQRHVTRVAQAGQAPKTSPEK